MGFLAYAIVGLFSATVCAFVARTVTPRTVIGTMLVVLALHLSYHHGRLAQPVKSEHYTQEQVNKLSRFCRDNGYLPKHRAERDLTGSRLVWVGCYAERS